MLEWLTPAERRGAATLVLILLLGAGYDAWETRRMRTELGRSAVTESFPEDPAPVPLVVDSTPATTGRGEAGRLDLNRATAAELEALPGIGPVLARRIVTERRQSGRFGALEELLRVRGVGPRLLGRLRPLVRVDLERAHSGPRPDSPRPAMHSAPSPSDRRADSASAPPSPSR